MGRSELNLRTQASQYLKNFYWKQSFGSRFIRQQLTKLYIPSQIRDYEKIRPIHNLDVAAASSPIDHEQMVAERKRTILIIKYAVLNNGVMKAYTG